MSQDGQPPVVLAFPLGRAREILTASGWRVERLLPTQDRRSSREGPGRETEAAPQPSEWEEWRVVRQRILGPGQVELLVAPEMRPSA
ncbi:MAG: hypothetical protein ACYC5Y_15670 [Symbiobacteriia bacterium]